ncbi:MAG: hypothetical protein HC853_12780 [Anaerolineae bacterium]|nr:hypothetical protein [Anaerolineae bacterium]
MDIAAPIKVGSLNAIASTIEARSSTYLTYRPDDDWFQFSTVQGQTYVVETFNVAGAIHPLRPLYMDVYDSNGTKIASDGNFYYGASGSGNAHSGLQFEATLGGTYFVNLYINDDGGSGPYQLRILPSFDQLEASWDSNSEPNNWPTHAFRLPLGRGNALATNIEERSATYHTYRPDVDWYRLDAIASQSYVVETFNVAKAINSREYALQLSVYDSNGSKIADGTVGSGNTSTSVEFKATLGGNYTIRVLPYSDYAASGPYRIRVLPSYDQPQASWDIGMEPNNFATISFPIDVGPCDRSATITERNSAFMTSRADIDWYVFRVERGKQYSFETSGYGTQFGANGVEIQLFDKEFSLIDESRGGEVTKLTFNANYDGVYYAAVWPDNWNGFVSGEYKVRVYEPLQEGCNGAPPDRAVVSGNVSSGTNPDTGEVTVVVPRSGSNVTISALIPCSASPQNVMLVAGTSTAPMSLVSGSMYRGTITLQGNQGTAQIHVRYMCNGSVQVRNLGEVQFVDPSGRILDAKTGNPIEGATVHLYRIPNALPDRNGQPNSGTCRTIETRGGSDWSNVTTATLVSSQVISPVLDALRDTQQISPTINPQRTGSDGRYAWDVVEGCWYISVAALGYQSRVSPLVGVPPAVTDLDIRLTLGQSGRSVYLPIIRR